MHAHPPAVNVFLSIRCAKTFTQLVTRRDVLGNFHGQDVMFDSRCDVSSGELLARAFQMNTPGLELVIDQYLRSALKHLENKYASIDEKSKSKLFLSAMILQHPPVAEVIAHNYFVAGKFRDGFSYLQAHWSETEFPYTDGQAGSLTKLGIKAAANSNFESATRSFKMAYTHARYGYYLPDVIYLLGVARAAEGRLGLAHATWRFGLPYANWSTSTTPIGVYWNYMMLGQLLGRRIPQH